MFSPPSHFIIHETAHWRVNQRTDASLPGYLIVSARHAAATSFEDLSTAALAELGPVLRDAVCVVERTLTPKRVYVTRYGHSPGHSIHFHVIPLYSWVVAAFRAIRAIGRWNSLTHLTRTTTSMAQICACSFPKNSPRV